VGVFVVDVQGRRHALGDDARPTSAAGDSPSLELAPKDQLHLFGAAQIKVLPDDLLEEGVSVEPPVPDLGEGRLGLENGKLVAVTGGAVPGGEGVGQAAEPLAEEGVNLLGTETLADPLGGRQIGAAQEAVVEGFEGDAAFGQLAFQLLMAVEAELGRIGE
jgi:hypothetical protein